MKEVKEVYKHETLKFIDNQDFINIGRNQNVFT